MMSRLSASHTFNMSLFSFLERFFKQSLLFFLNENRNYYPDLKFNVTLNEEDYNKLMDGGFEITVKRVGEERAVVTAPL